MKELARKNILNMKAYCSARIDATEQELATQILMNANENPYHLLEDEGFNRYPEPQPARLKKLLSEFYRVGTDELLITAGSDQGIDLLLRAFCEPKQDTILICSPTFGMYRIYAQIQDVKILDIPLGHNDGFQLNMGEIRKTQAVPPKIVFIPNPSAPMGHLLREADLLELCEIFSGTSLVVIDEAYIEFSKQESLAAKIRQFRNLVILRTLSKAFSGAGLRVGALIANREIIEILRPVLSPYPLTVPSIEKASRILQDDKRQEANENIRKILQEKERIKKTISCIKCITAVYPSDTNFLFIEAENAEAIVNYLEKKDIVIRSCGANKIRVSIGTPEENDAFLKALKSFEEK